MIIFSVEQDRHPLENKACTIEAIQELAKNGSFVTACGVYNGSSEVSFITNQVELGRTLAKRYEQECYLERGHYGYWYLIETDTNSIIDTFKTIKEVSKAEALASDCYTVFNDTYYLAKKY